MSEESHGLDNANNNPSLASESNSTPPRSGDKALDRREALKKFAAYGLGAAAVAAGGGKLFQEGTHLLKEKKQDILETDKEGIYTINPQFSDALEILKNGKDTQMVMNEEEAGKFLADIAATAGRIDIHSQNGLGVNIEIENASLEIHDNEGDFSSKGTVTFVDNNIAVPVNVNANYQNSGQGYLSSTYDVEVEDNISKFFLEKMGSFQAPEDFTIEKYISYLIDDPNWTLGHLVRIGLEDEFPSDSPKWVQCNMEFKDDHLITNFTIEGD